MGNRNSSSSKVHGHHVTRVASTKLGYDSRVERPVTKFRDEYTHKPKAETPRTFKGTSVYSEQKYCNTPLDNDETFTSFIRHAKYKITTVSHIEQEQNNVAPAPAPPLDDEANARDNQNDQFSNFIQSAKKKLRTAPSMRKNGSFNIG